MKYDTLDELELAIMGHITEPPGWFHPGYTMIGKVRMDNLKVQVESILERNVPGDLCECGVWRGGACIWMRGILEAHGDTERAVWLCDSFQGVPPPDSEHYPIDAPVNLNEFPVLAVPMEQVAMNFANCGMLRGNNYFIKGWFRDTLPWAGIEKLALLRVDGDLYESTIQVFDALYPKLSVGGIVIVDDYGAMVQCKTAVDDYRTQHHITTPFNWTDNHEVWWEKEG